MSTPLASRGLPFAIGAATAAISVVAAIVVLAVVSVDRPQPTESVFSLNRGWYQAASAAALLLIAIWLRGRLEAVAFASLAAVCLLAGWGIQVVEYDFEAPRSLVFALRLVEGIALVPATTAVIAAFASTPQRSLGRRMPAVLVVTVAVSVIAVVGQTVIRER